MKKILNALMLPALLLVLWLLLNDTLSPGQILLGVALALFLAWAARAMRPLRSHPRHLPKAVKLLGHVLIDVTHSNLMVARIIWLGRRANVTPGFIQIPIKLKDPHALAVLACIITFTPGTVWSDYSVSKGIMTLHVLDLKDESHWIELIRTRYEAPLKEIFE